MCLLLEVDFPHSVCICRQPDSAEQTCRLLRDPFSGWKCVEKPAPSSPPTPTLNSKISHHYFIHVARERS